MWSVVFVFLSYLDRNFVVGDSLSRYLDVDKESKETFCLVNGTCCAKMSTLGENFLYQVSNGAEVVRSVVSPNRKLLNCSVTVNKKQVKSFMHECRLEENQGTGWHLEARFTRMDEAKLMCREFKMRTGMVEKNYSDHPAVQDKVVKRSKRGFTYPGTLWCGAGNMADHDGQLGDFAETDSCCRTHDHCPHVIHAFSSKYGYTNFKWHSICHCDCDSALRACLREVNDTSSRVVGQAFFNVIGVPCFDFGFEEQCAERHWYGVCKRYEKRPIAVLREAVPYDYGGIDVIDVLTLAPPKKKDFKKNKEEERPESPTQSTVSGPEEPSLRNVVIAAEDFIKVLATVSTSQSSAAESDNGESQSSEKKKKRKNPRKKKEDSKKRKGKGRKRKQKAEVVVQIEEGAPTPGTKAREVLALSNFISESHNQDQSGRNTHTAGDNEYKLRGKEEPSNELMKDEPAMDKETASILSHTSVEEKPAESAEEVPPSPLTAFSPHKAKNRRDRRRKKKLPFPFTGEVIRHIGQPVMNITDNLSILPVPAIMTVTPTARPEQQSFIEKRPFVSTASTPIIISKVKRDRSKERGDKEGRKKRRKVSSDSPIVAAAHQNSSADGLNVTPPNGSLTVTSVNTTQLQISHMLYIYGRRGCVHDTVLNPPYSISERQRSKDGGPRNKRRRKVATFSGESPLFQNSPENTLHFPDTSGASKSPTTTASTRLTEGTGTHSESVPSIIAERLGMTIRQQRKTRKKAGPPALPVPKHRGHITETFATTSARVASTDELNLQSNSKPFTTTSAAPYMSPIQLSIQRTKEQFSRKKRRKAARSIRQQ